MLFSLFAYTSCPYFRIYKELEKKPFLIAFRNMGKSPAHCQARCLPERFPYFEGVFSLFLSLQNQVGLSVFQKSLVLTNIPETIGFHFLEYSTLIFDPFHTFLLYHYLFLFQMMSFLKVTLLFLFHSSAHILFQCDLPSNIQE